MREIKFRIYNRFLKEFRYFRLLDNDAFILYAGEDIETITQFTGLKDKNDKCVFEGDLVKSKYYDLSEVVWHDKYATFCLRTVDDVVKDEYTYSLGEIEVIGNIYENPNLLKEQK